jgi:VanZ family protein
MPRSDSSRSDGSKLTISLIALGLVGALALLGAPMPRQWSDSGSLLARALLNFAHFPLFVFVAFVVCRTLGCRTLKQHGWAMLIVLAVSIGSELAQTLTSSREASWSDATTNMLGALAGSGLWALVSMKPRSMTSRAAGPSLLIAACTVVAFLPVTTPIRIRVAQERAFPELYNGHFPGTESLVESLADLDEVELKTQGGSLYVTLLKGTAPGVVFWRFASDWRGFARLAIDVENLEQQPLVLGVHVRDRESTAEYDDRFNAQRQLASRERALLEFELVDVESGPSGRPISLDEISLIAIHRVSPGSSRFAVRSLRLE